MIALKEFSLTTTLHVTNTSSSIPFDFQALFHTYHACPSKNVRVKPLKGITWFDKTVLTDGNPTQKVETREEGVDVLLWTDAVFEATPAKLEISWPGGGVDVKTSGTRDTVIWNPREGAGRKIPEMEEGGWYKVLVLPYHTSSEHLHTGRNLSASNQALRRRSKLFNPVKFGSVHKR